jgi:hypothetical protein
MLGGVKKTPGTKTGFTIIEVMIFLAVSGVIFLIAAQFINGKQAQADFTQGMHNADAIVMTLINNVANGNYALPAGDYLSCSFKPGGGLIVNAVPASPSTVYYGTPGCSFVGLVLAPETNSNPYIYSTFTVAGCQYVLSGGGGCTSSPNSVPTQYIANEYPSVVTSMTQSANWPGQLEITSMYIVDSSTGTSSPTGAVGVFGVLPQTGSTGILQAGSQQTATAELSRSSLTDSPSQIVSEIDSPVKPPAWLPATDYVVMCFTGPNTEKGSISIGSPHSGGQLTTTLLMGQAVVSPC